MIKKKQKREINLLIDNSPIGAFHANFYNSFQHCLKCKKSLPFKLWNVTPTMSSYEPLKLLWFPDTVYLIPINRGHLKSFLAFYLKHKWHQILNDCAEMASFTWSSSWCISGHESWFGSSNALFRLERNLELVRRNIESLGNLISTKFSGLSLNRFVYYHIVIFTAVAR